MDGGAETIHYLIERDPSEPAFSHDLAAMLPFGARNPLYAVLHESSYADGGRTRWSADRVQPDDFRGEATLLTGEHLFPWHFEDSTDLQPYRDIAMILAEHDWPRSVRRSQTRRGRRPVRGRDLRRRPYVDRTFSEQTADLLPGMRRWLTDEYLHNGLRTAGDRILDRLIELVRDT